MSPLRIFREMTHPLQIHWESPSRVDISVSCVSNFENYETAISRVDTYDADVSSSIFTKRKNQTVMLTKRVYHILISPFPYLCMRVCHPVILTKRIHQVVSFAKRIYQVLIFTNGYDKF